MRFDFSFLPLGAAAAALMLFAPPLCAHSGPPRGSSIIVAPSDPNHVLVRTTYGMVMTRDGGVSFEWLCGAAAGYNDEIELPEAAIFGNASLLLGTFDGPTTSSNLGCDWNFLSGDGTGPEQKYIRDIAPGQTADEATMLYTNAIGGFAYEVELWHTNNAGQQWLLKGEAPPSDFLPFNARIAPSDSDRIYMAGQDGTQGSLRQIVMRSDDGGDNWQRIVLTEESPNASSVIIGIDPNDPNIVYASSITTAGTPLFQLFRSLDGVTFEEVWQENWAGTQAALSPDGTMLALGAPAQGLLLANATAPGMLATTAAANINVSCLNWSESGIYACADEELDGFAVGKSTDGGATFAPFMQLDSPCRPLSCDEGSDVDNACPELWLIEQEELGADNCYPYPEPPIVDPPDADSCDCEVAAPNSQGPSGWWLSLLAAAVLRRNRRRKG